MDGIHQHHNIHVFFIETGVMHDCIALLSNNTGNTNGIEINHMELWKYGILPELRTSCCMYISCAIVAANLQPMHVSPNTQDSNASGKVYSVVLYLGQVHLLPLLGQTGVASQSLGRR